MSPKTFIEREIKKFAKKYIQAKFRYEYRISTNTHIIEVLPQLFYEENIDYLTDEYKLETFFECNYPNDNIIFISENSLSEIHHPDLDLSNINNNIKLKDILDTEIKNADCWIEYDADAYKAIINAMMIACEQCIDNNLSKNQINYSIE